MIRFIRIENNMIVSERYDSLNRIVEGEIEGNETHGSVGQTLVDGVWIYDLEVVGVDEIALGLLQSEGVI